MVIAGCMDAGDMAERYMHGIDGFSTFYGYYMLEALARAGRYDDALDAISRYWGGMLDLGATTFWEDYDPAWGSNANRIDEIGDPRARMYMATSEPTATRAIVAVCVMVGLRVPPPGCHATCWGLR